MRYLSKIRAVAGLTLPKVSAGVVPAAGELAIYGKSDDLLYTMSSAGVERGLSGSQGPPGAAGPVGATGTRWGQTPSWVLGETANIEVWFADGQPVRVGDMVVSYNGLGPGEVYGVSAVQDPTHATLYRTYLSLRGPEGAVNGLGAWPVGSIFVGFGPTNPELLVGGGTWVLFGSGRTLIGFDSADADYNADGKQGGSKTVVIQPGNTPAHLHAIGAHNHGIARAVAVGSSGQKAAAGNGTAISPDGMTSDNNATYDSGNGTASGLKGNPDPLETRDPYVVVHFWRRTA